MNKILIVAAVLFSATAQAQLQDICGTQDLRSPSHIAPVARMWAFSGIGIPTEPPNDIINGCTGTLISKSCMISAGHCLSKLQFAQFNVPPSLPDGSILYPSAKDEYAVDSIIDSLNADNGDSPNGQDWAVFRTKKNQITGKYAGEVQGFYSVNSNNPSPFIGKQVRVTGFGKANGERNQAQQTSVGILFFDPSVPVVSYDAFTSTGSSGSAVILETTKEVIGIHTTSGCHGGPKLNAGSSIWNNPVLKEAIQKCLSLESDQAPQEQK